MILAESYQSLMTEYNQEELVCEMTVSDENGRKHTMSEVFLPYKHIKLPDPRLKYQITESDDKFVVTITAEAFAAFVELDLIEADAIFADNYFNISGNEAVTVELKKSDIWNKEKINISELDRTLKIRSLFDTYQS